MFNLDLATAASIATVAAVIAAFLSAYSAKKANDYTKYKTIVELWEQYRSKEMYHAVKELWHFHDQYTDKKQMQKAYRNIIEQTRETEQRIEHGTIDFQRRTVKMFYEALAAFYFGGVIPKKICNMLWDKCALKIILDIVDPMEEEKSRKTGHRERLLSLKLYNELPDETIETEEEGNGMSNILGLMLISFFVLVMAFTTGVVIFNYFFLDKFLDIGVFKWTLLMFLGGSLITVVGIFKKGKEKENTCQLAENRDGQVVTSEVTPPEADNSGTTEGQAPSS